MSHTNDFERDSSDKPDFSLPEEGRTVLITEPAFSLIHEFRCKRSRKARMMNCSYERCNWVTLDSKESYQHQVDFRKFEESMMNEENANEKDQDDLLANGQRVWTTTEALPMLRVTFPMLQESRMNGRKGLDELDLKEMGSKPCCQECAASCSKDDALPCIMLFRGRNYAQCYFMEEKFTFHFLI
jgi:hypothetical protein